MLRAFRVALAAPLALVSLSLPASALTITQTQGFIAQPNIARIVDFDRFDPANGALESVEWRFNLNIEGGSLTVDNDGIDAATVEVMLGAEGSLSSSDVRLLDDAFQGLFSGATALSVGTGSTFDLAGDDGDGVSLVDPNAPDAGVHQGQFASTSDTGFVNSDFFVDYVGTDMFALTVDIDQLLDFGGIGGVSGAFDPVTAEANVTLIYNYVPEPNSLALVTFGTIGLSLARRRRP